MTHNNNIISDEIEYFYDSSTGRLIRSVYVPQGKVQAYTGEFRTLSVDSITINNPATLINNVIKQAYDIPHNSFASNFSDTNLEKIYENVNRSQNELICHDASVVAIPPFNNMTVLGLMPTSAGASDTITLYNAMEAIAAKIKQLQEKYEELKEQVSADLKWTNSKIELPDGAESFINKPTNIEITYPKSYMYATIVQLKRQGVSPLHINDLKQPGTHNHTYYPISNPVIVNNDNYIAIECWEINRIIAITFNKTTENAPFMFLLNRYDKNGKRLYLQVNYTNNLDRLQLMCIGYTEEFGTVWDVYNWSGNSDDFKLVEI